MRAVTRHSADLSRKPFGAKEADPSLRSGLHEVHFFEFAGLRRIES
jgi:hypothetical protein